LPISAFAVGGTLGLVGYQVDRLINQHNYYGSPASSYNQTSDGKPDLYYGSSNVDNVYVFDAHGKALTDVFLYDQNGEGYAAVVCISVRHSRLTVVPFDRAGIVHQADKLGGIELVSVRSGALTSSHILP
jgi:hypothetical protein